MENYYLHVDGKKANHAGSKAVEDCETILREIGFIRIRAYSSFFKIKLMRKLVKGLQLLRLFFLPIGSVLVIEHPIYIKNRYLKDLKKLKEIRKIKLIFIIHDIESFRKLLKNEEKYKEKDDFMISIADIIIAHNPKMIKMINQVYGFPMNKMVSLDIFDYLLNTKVDSNKNKKGKDLGIMIVGNLNPQKVGYLYSSNFNNNISKFNLFGPEFDEKKLVNGNYFGQYSPDEIIEKLEGSFGLVWDGNSANTCDGNIGKYLKINNPHKTSMYIAAKYPIIIWEEAALADFVISNGIGITIKNLWEIPEKIEKITENEYNIMLDNVSRLSDKITSGYFLKKALGTAVEKLEEI